MRIAKTDHRPTKQSGLEHRRRSHESTATSKKVVNNSTPDSGTHDVFVGHAAKKTGKAENRYPRLIKYITHAKHSLLLRLVDLSDEKVVEHLLAAAKRGVDVRICFAAKPARSAVELRRLRQLERAGIDIVVRKPDVLQGTVAIVDGTLLRGHDGHPTSEVSSPASLTQAQQAFHDALRTNQVTQRVGLLAPGKLVFYAMPEATAAPILNAINSSKKSIDLEIYELSEPSVVAALERAVQRGVHVRVMLESKTVGHTNYPTMSKKLRAAGIDVKPTPAKFHDNWNVDHAKILICDHQEVLIGTGNLVRSGLGGYDRPDWNNRDFWVETSHADHVKDATTIFDDDWQRIATKPSDITSLVITPENDEDKIFGLMNAAKKRLWVYNQSLDDDETINCLLAAKKRGVDVRVLLGVQLDANGVPKNEPAKKTLEAAGIKVEYYTAHYLHAKGIVSDETAYLGSQNFTDGGMDRNREAGVIITSSQLADNLAKIFTQDFANPGPPPSQSKVL